MEFARRRNHPRFPHKNKISPPLTTIGPSSVFFVAFPSRLSFFPKFSFTVFQCCYNEERHFKIPVAFSAPVGHPGRLRKETTPPFTRILHSSLSTNILPSFTTSISTFLSTIPESPLLRKVKDFSFSQDSVSLFLLTVLLRSLVSP